MTLARRPRHSPTPRSRPPGPGRSRARPSCERESRLRRDGSRVPRSRRDRRRSPAEVERRLSVGSGRAARGAHRRACTMLSGPGPRMRRERRMGGTMPNTELAEELLAARGSRCVVRVPRGDARPDSRHGTRRSSRGRGRGSPSACEPCARAGRGFGLRLREPSASRLDGGERRLAPPPVEAVFSSPDCYRSDQVT